MCRFNCINSPRRLNPGRPRLRTRKFESKKAAASTRGGGSVKTNGDDLIKFTDHTHVYYDVKQIHSLLATWLSRQRFSSSVMRGPRSCELRPPPIAPWPNHCILSQQ